LTRAKVISFYKSNPGATRKYAAEVIGDITPQRVGQVLRKAQADGLVKLNGRKVEVI